MLAGQDRVGRVPREPSKLWQAPHAAGGGFTPGRAWLGQRLPSLRPEGPGWRPAGRTSDWTAGRRQLSCSGVCWCKTRRFYNGCQDDPWPTTNTLPDGLAGRRQPCPPRPTSPGAPRASSPPPAGSIIAAHRAAGDRLRGALQRGKSTAINTLTQRETPGLRVQDAGPHPAHQPVRARSKDAPDALFADLPGLRLRCRVARCQRRAGSR